MYRGIEKNQNYTWLICAAQNMKNIAIKKEKYGHKSIFLIYFLKVFLNNKKT